ncbi:MAG TPA: hypothetical protein VFP65_07030 [Anaeromyxobacteraceae bacterium]|nr:hypothetical protein [Anaeromyxobacteraceae bacterium]
MRRVQLTALATLLCFGCATVHEPAPTAYGPPPGTAPRVVLAEPELELWMEGTKAIDPAETAQALEASRTALAEAVSGRGLDGPDADELLVVRSRAIQLTGERRSAQVWSVVGIVVVVVAVVVAAVLLSRSGSHGGRGGGSGSHAAVPAGGRAPAPVPYAPRYYAPPPPIGVSIGLSVTVPSPSPGPWAPPPGAIPMEQRLSSRGWFDGDEVELSVELVDARTGVPSWRRIVREGIDPRDGAAVARLLDRALEGLPFGQRLAPADAPER